jgi:ABC-type bacteriocin/lantibiotic exporter with double-glycine peptidase domain
MYEDASQIANDAVGSIRTVASFCAEEKVVQLYEEKCEGPLKVNVKESLISGIGFGMANFFLFNVYAINIYAGAQLVKNGKATFQDFFQVNKPSIDNHRFFFQILQNFQEIDSTKFSFNLLDTYVYVVCRLQFL